MPWCPKSKNEYVEGIKVCADCGTELVDSLEENNEEDNHREDIQLFLKKYTDEIVAAEKIIEDENLTDDEKSAIERFVVDENPEDAEAENAVWRRAYQNSAQKAEDNKSSAYTLLFLGVIGLAVCILILSGVIPMYQNSVTTKYLVCGVMSALFILFIVFGFVSMKSFKVLTLKAKSEDSLLEEITKWCEENLTVEKIDAGLFDNEEIPEEQKYFARTDKMKKIIQDKFMNLEEAFLDNFIDDYYQNLF